MTCERVVAVLDVLAADPPAGPEHDELIRHVAHCPQCTQAFREYMTIIRVAGTLAQTPPPPGVRQRLRDFIADAIRRKADHVPMGEGEPRLSATDPE